MHLLSSDTFLLIAITISAFSSVSGAPAPAPAPAQLDPNLSKRQGGTTRNDLVNGDCKAVTMIFARGTTEPGNVGTVAGPPFFQALEQDLGADNVAVQGVDYAANVAGFLQGGDPAGAQTLADLTAQAASQCPDTQIVLSGYSQGAQVVHKGVEQVAADVKSNQVKCVVLFGDPDNGQPLDGIDAADVQTFCANGDAICDGQALVLPPHLSYGRNADEAADFVAGKVTV